MYTPAKSRGRANGSRRSTKRAKMDTKKNKGAIMRVQPALRSNTLGGPFPVRKKCQLVYTEIPSISVTSGSGAYIFATNDMYDPNVTGTGTQPLYFDQISAIYNHFVVTSSFLEYQVMGSTTSRDLITTVYIDDDTTSTGFATTDAQRPGAKTTALNPGVNMWPTIRLGWNAARNFGPGVLNNELFRGSNAASPAERMFYIIKIADLGLGSFDIPVRVKITFNCEWTELRTIGAS